MMIHPLRRWQERRIAAAWRRECAGDRAILEEYYDYAQDPATGATVSTLKPAAVNRTASSAAQSGPATRASAFTPDGTTVHVAATAYSVSCLPDDRTYGSRWTIIVKYAGSWSHRQPRPADRQWSIEHLGYFLGRDGTWEPPRSGDWWESHRFGLDEALELARRQAPHLTMAGLTVADMLEQRARRAAEEGRGAR